MRANCYKCHQEYQSNDIEDLEGAGFCVSCKELKKKIAFSVDIKMAELRKNRIVPERVLLEPTRGENGILIAPVVPLNARKDLNIYK